MACELWGGKLDAYLDGELPAAEERTLREHLQGCPGCAAESLQRLQTKRAIAAAGQRFVPDAAFRARMQARLSPAKPARRSFRWFPALAAVAALVVVGVLFVGQNRDRAREQNLLGELADLHVATLASANPVDVISTDRHTVKPWFAGKIPFTFNLPELNGTPFVLVGGRISYLNQSPGAELIFRVRQHQISVFIFQDRAVGSPAVTTNSGTALSFTVRSWSKNGLSYFVLGDASGDDLDKLSSLLKASS
ncbi:MAG TPA: zf-HC2 domain-containing protein [Terriglobales bacterium]|jgi:anti-sigma factor RsiW|nr:zf-HC2 domain-containing protein [Terriglobales bacterium]